MATADVEAVWRIESARIVAALTRFTGDFGLAEDATQEAVAEALASWPVAAPANPAGWLMATARRRAIDAVRRRTALQDRYALLAAGPAVDDEIDPDRIDDDVLAPMFVSCHPVLSREARVALTLRVVGGLSSEEIARAFLVPVPTVQARITRGKKTIAAAGVPFELPAADERRERLGGVLSVLYVIFTEGRRPRRATGCCAPTSRTRRSGWPARWPRWPRHRLAASVPMACRPRSPPPTRRRPRSRRPIGTGS